MCNWVTTLYSRKTCFGEIKKKSKKKKRGTLKDSNQTKKKKGNKHVKSCLTSLVIRKVKTNVTMDYHVTHTRKTKMEKVILSCQ